MGNHTPRLMKKLACFCSLGLLLFLSACASKPDLPEPHSMLPQQPIQQPSPPPQRQQQKQPPEKNMDIVGTWQWVLDNGTPVNRPFYVRYYPNGKISSWPSPKNWSDSKGVSHGRYSVAKNFLTLEIGSSTNNPKSRLEIKDHEMLITTVTGHQLGYRRITPALTPGKLPDGKPAGFAQQ